MTAARLGAALGLWLVIGAGLFGPTVLVLRLAVASWTSAHRAAGGAILIIEAYVALLVALLVAGLPLHLGW